MSYPGKRSRLHYTRLPPTSVLVTPRRLPVWQHLNIRQTKLGGRRSAEKTPIYLHVKLSIVFAESAEDLERQVVVAAVDKVLERPTGVQRNIALIELVVGAGLEGARRSWAGEAAVRPRNLGHIFDAATHRSIREAEAETTAAAPGRDA